MGKDIYRVHMILQKEEGGKILAHKSGRIHETDFSAGVFHCEIKLKEILVDADQIMRNGSVP
jgi:hypothetical protein